MLKKTISLSFFIIFLTAFTTPTPFIQKPYIKDKQEEVLEKAPCLLKVSSQCQSGSTVCFFSYTEKYNPDLHKDACYKLFEICMDTHVSICLGSFEDDFQECVLKEKEKCNLKPCKQYYLKKFKEECEAKEEECFSKSVKSCLGKKQNYRYY